MAIHGDTWEVHRHPLASEIVQRDADQRRRSAGEESVRSGGQLLGRWIVVERESLSRQARPQPLSGQRPIGACARNVVGVERLDRSRERNTHSTA